MARLLGSECFGIEPASSDASFRRYWRVTQNAQTWIAMDAPPEHEDCGRYADLSRRFRSIGINTPEIHAEDRAQGFLLISDLGERVYLSQLQASNADRLYGDALGALAIIQSCGPREGLPVYDAAFLWRELGLFRQWLLEAHLGLRLDDAEQALLERVYARLVESALEQPLVCVHRDYHSRNLMVMDRGNPGVLDFQDAVVGPVTYDLVSLLRDCYIAWPQEQVLAWALGYFQLARQSGILHEQDSARFIRWMDLMGLQRHLKACGIFARLKIRDGKSHYLADIPRTLGYVLEVADRYPDLLSLASFLRDRVVPLMPEAAAS